MKLLLLLVCGSALAMTYSETEPSETLANFPLQLEIPHQRANTYSLTDARAHRLTLSVVPKPEYRIPIPDLRASTYSLTGRLTLSVIPKPEYGKGIPSTNLHEVPERWSQQLDAPGPGYREQQRRGAELERP